MSILTTKIKIIPHIFAERPWFLALLSDYIERSTSKWSFEALFLNDITIYFETCCYCADNHYSHFFSNIFIMFL